MVLIVKFRWHNHLDPQIRKEAWTIEEERVLANAHRVYGNKWAEIAKLLPGRTDNSIKNHWNCSLKKRLDVKSCSVFLSLSTPTAQPEIPHKALAAEDSAVALAIQGLKLNAVDGKGTETNFLYT
ncbi:hypothetical protein EJB05_35862, partial [Eragrostis curvula]